MRAILICVSLTFLLWACRGKGSEPERDTGDEPSFMQWEENDTLSFSAMPQGLSAWLSYFQAADTGFRIGNFKASGVVLHFGDMPDAISTGVEGQWAPYFNYSPDSSRYLDLFSYDHFLDDGKPVEGEADQQVALADPRNGLRKQLMYNGPGQYADFADWLGKDIFIIGSRIDTEDGKSTLARIMAFRITDSSFTNFDLDHAIPLETMRRAGTGFGESYFNIIKRK
jgi:hypothetical protein